MDIYQEIIEFYKNVRTEKKIVGKSLFGRDIFAVKAGEGRPIGIAQYAIHGREFITAKLAMEQYRVGVRKGSCWFIPLLNPDGCLLSQKGLESVRAEDREYLLSLNEGSTDFSLWKANGRGVDLNVNFDAEWGKGVKNVRRAGRENYIGARAFSESETYALKRFTELIRPDYTLSYHTKGEEIYWYFYQSISDCARDKTLAIALSDETGYPLAHARGSAGGYKDWCIRKFGIPSFTIEVGKEELLHPLGEESLADITEKNRYAVWRLSKKMVEIKGLE